MKSLNKYNYNYKIIDYDKSQIRELGRYTFEADQEDQSKRKDCGDWPKIPACFGSLMGSALSSVEGENPQKRSGLRPADDQNNNAGDLDVSDLPDNRSPDMSS
tara:strand:- start:1026 stop:1334 length:309 start_codon:yes stop_codon:yes gene_type:complete